MLKFQLLVCAFQCINPWIKVNSVLNNIMFNQAVLATRFVMTNPLL